MAVLKNASSKARATTYAIVNISSYVMPIEGFYEAYCK